MNKILNERGVALLEVVVSIAIIGTAVIGLVGALGVGLRASTSIEHHQTAVTLVSSQIEYSLADSNLSSNGCPAIEGPVGYSLVCQVSDSQIEVTVMSEDKELLTGTLLRGDP